ncbi:MAG: hypothetical protein FWH00_00185 [Oscillospiraceae bacterium]|nr:hypothetical protein [Oscillospiraceae bacterium]
MLSFEEAREALGEIADSLPREIYASLNGGVILLPRSKRHPKGRGIYILGEYHHEPVGFGRYITLYYGSFRRVFGDDIPDGKLIAELGATLRHELIHHIESLAGDVTLELKDEYDMEGYLRE